jgi:hypothetical protein
MRVFIFFLLFFFKKSSSYIGRTNLCLDDVAPVHTEEEEEDDGSGDGKDLQSMILLPPSIQVLKILSRFNFIFYACCVS